MVESKIKTSFLLNGEKFKQKLLSHFITLEEARNQLSLEEEIFFVDNEFPIDQSDEQEILLSEVFENNVVNLFKKPLVIDDTIS